VSQGGDEESATIDSCNAILPELAAQAGTGFIALPAMPEHHTIDRNDLNAAGYAGADRAILPASRCKSA